MNKPLVIKGLPTPIEVLLQIDENGMTSAKKLYEFLGLDSTHYSRWAKKNILENPFAIENVDFTPLAINGECGGQATTDYKITASFAKKLAMGTNNKQGEIAKEYFLKVEERLIEETQKQSAQLATVESLPPELQMVKALFDNAVKHESAIQEHNADIQELKQDVEQLKQSREDVVYTIKELPRNTLDNQAILSMEIKDHSATVKPRVFYTMYDIARMFNIGSRLLPVFLEKHGILSRYRKNRGWTISERYAEAGYTYEHNSKNKTIQGGINHHFYWTETGAEFIIEFLKAKGMAPTESLYHAPSRNISKESV